MTAAAASAQFMDISSFPSRSVRSWRVIPKQRSIPSVRRFHHRVHNDLVLLARHGQGRVLVRTGRLAEGLALFDEVMVGVTAGDASALVVGDVYCSVISACSDIFDFHRAQEWTASLSAWCAAQPDLVAHRGECMVHRAELAQFHGAWADAMTELVHACERLSDPPGSAAPARRLSAGRAVSPARPVEKAEETYRTANQLGRRRSQG
jgi:hypothetical protein